MIFSGDKNSVDCFVNIIEFDDGIYESTELPLNDLEDGD